MRIQTCSTLILVLALTGCLAKDNNGPLAPGMESSFARVPTPFTARCQLTPLPAEPLGPGLIRLVDVGTCQASHLGRADFVSDKVIDLAAGTQTVEATFTAANGDVLRGSGSGTSQPVGPGVVAFEATLTFVGGTGRFRNASGTAAVHGEANLAASESWLQARGSIRY